MEDEDLLAAAERWAASENRRALYERPLLAVKITTPFTVQGLFTVAATHQRGVFFMPLDKVYGAPLRVENVGQEDVKRAIASRLAEGARGMIEGPRAGAWELGAPSFVDYHSVGFKGAMISLSSPRCVRVEANDESGREALRSHWRDQIIGPLSRHFEAHASDVFFIQASSFGMGFPVPGLWSDPASGSLKSMLDRLSLEEGLALAAPGVGSAPRSPGL